MSDCEDLCAIIHRGIGLNFKDLAEEIIAAGFHRNRTITTADELDKCPPGTAVIDSIGLYALVTVGHQVTSFGVVKLWPYEELLTFPVTVLHEEES